MQEYNEKALKAGREETKSTENIMVGSKLTVRVVKGEGFVYNTSKARVRLTLNDKRQETSEATDLVNPEWN
jgi:hypothetical protein